MWSSRYVVISIYLLQTVSTVRVKVVMHSDEDSKIEDEIETHTEPWDRKKKDVIMLPFLKDSRKRFDDKQTVYVDERQTTRKPRQLHPNEMLFPLIYKQNHINSMFKFGENWYSWAAEKRNDGSTAVNYYICYDEPKRCDEIGWERTDNLPKCAFQIESLMADDRACTNSFGVEPHNGALCDGGEQMKVSEIVRACGPRIRSLWRFVRVDRRPLNAAKPADVNSLICEDEEECYITIEYRIHHDRITFSIHEPSRGQTFKSALKRELLAEDDKATAATEGHPRFKHRNKKIPRDEETSSKSKRFHLRLKTKNPEGKGVEKERNSESYGSRILVKNKIKIREDVSDDLSE